MTKKKPPDKSTQSTVNKSAQSASKKKAPRDGTKSASKNSDLLKTQAGAAKYAGCDERTIRRWINNGMPLTKDNQYSKMMLDLFKKGGGRAPNEHKDRDIQAGADIKTIRAKLYELEYKVKTGELIDADDEQQRRLYQVVVVRQALLAMPRRIGPQLVGKSARKIIKLLREEVEFIINTFANDQNKIET